MPHLESQIVILYEKLSDIKCDCKNSQRCLITLSLLILNDF